MTRLEPEVIENRLAEWRRLLCQSVTQARAVLQRVLVGRITFTPTGKGCTFAAPTRFDKLFNGIVVPRPAFIENGNRGAEHLGPEVTFDSDYGRLLEHAMALTYEGEASPPRPVIFPHRPDPGGPPPGREGLMPLAPRPRRRPPFSAKTPAKAATVTTDANGRQTLALPRDAETADALCLATGCSTEIFSLKLAAQACDVQTVRPDAADPLKLFKDVVKLFEDLKPGDPFEAMLAVQMLGAHEMAVEFLRRSKLPNQPAEFIDRHVNRAVRLMRLFTEQLEARALLKGKTRQRITVEHLHVHEGGRAAVGTFAAEPLPAPDPSASLVQPGAHADLVDTQPAALTAARRPRLALRR